MASLKARDRTRVAHEGTFDLFGSTNANDNCLADAFSGERIAQDCSVADYEPPLAMERPRTRPDGRRKLAVLSSGNVESGMACALVKTLLREAAGFAFGAAQDSSSNPVAIALGEAPDKSVL
ncbi:hypothetical protein [Rubidibacter lacunae]|uniref:hypothetical protein n=1 Tax=Rubidibacter lacunae TaxID=582514 RepID=UPI000427BFF0|nr:hypothetical protein [Rubidibacter lacunae]